MRKGAGNVGESSLVILKTTREASCTGERFGSKSASHPHISPASAVTHPCLPVSKTSSVSNLVFILRDSRCSDQCVMTSFIGLLGAECVRDRGTNNKSICNYRVSQHGVVPALLIELFMQVCKSSCH